MSYKYRLTLPKHLEVRRRKRVVRLLIFLILILLAGAAIFIWYVSRKPNINQPSSGIKSASFQPLQTFDTPSFTFEADKSWSFVENESTSNIFVYRSSKNNIVSRDLYVYVNTLPKDPLVTRVLPVEPQGNGFSPRDVSQHCKDYLKDRIYNNSPIEGVVESVSIRCQVDGTSNTVGTGQVNGNYQTRLGNNDFYLLYHDLEFTPRFSVFTNIVQSFEAK